MSIGSAALITQDGEDGPLTRARLRRTFFIYLGLCVIGLLPSIFGASAALQAIGLGLIIPGGGFVSVGGWALLLAPLSLLLMGLALVAWAGSGMNIAPPLVWLGSALLAGAVSGDSAYLGAPYLVGAAAVAFQIYARTKSKASTRADLQKRDERNVYLPQAITAVKSRAEQKTAMGERELTPEQLAALRYCLDLALQPVGELKGFTKIDQFQTAALRYQLNSLGYLLSTVQCQVMPNFHGYLAQAQRRVIEQYLQRPIWSYWRLENLWGNLNANPDPVGKDNIMLTGFLGINLGLYQSNTGDRRYEQAGSLPFRWSEQVVFKHDFHTIVNSIVDNMQANPFCLYPCEPNWIYTPCNFRGLTSLILHDRLCGTHHFEHVAPNFFEKLRSEFTKASGSLHSLRSSITGLSVPFPFEESGRTAFDNAIDQTMALQDWAIVRHEMISESGEKIEIRIPPKSVDFGNYGMGDTLALGMLLQGAMEMGDLAVATALKTRLDEECGRELNDGVLRFKGSTAANLCVHTGMLGGRDFWRDTVRQGPPASAFTGPLLTAANYPEVLVARAFSPDASSLDMVLYNGRDAGLQTLCVERLQAGHKYQLTSPRAVEVVVADAQGCLRISVELNGRTPVVIAPLAAS